MSERKSLQKVFEGILSSQSFELLKDYSDDASWTGLQPEEKELLSQLFLLSAERIPCEQMEQKKHARQAYQAACQLSPSSARVWFRLGAFLALSEDNEELYESLEALRKAVSIDSRFFDAQYALGSVSLRLAILLGDEDLLFQADKAFTAASSLVEEKAIPAQFYWHWGIIWTVIARHSGEPADLKKAVDHFAKARIMGCARPDFFNDYANILVELGLAISSDDLILQATMLYTAALETSQQASEKEKAVRFFNLGCCYHHLFEATSEKQFFDKANHSFEMTTTLDPTTFTAWERWGFLLSRGWRIWRKSSLAEQASRAFKNAEKNGPMSAVDLATASQAFLWYGLSSQDNDLLQKAYEYAQRAMNLYPNKLMNLEPEKIGSLVDIGASFSESGKTNSLDASQAPHPECFVALALCYLERGKYFDDASYIEKALSLLQQGVIFFPRSAALWQAIAATKWSQADMHDDSSALRDTLLAYTIASRSFFAFSSGFWADWGVAMLRQAELSEDPLLACESIAKFERALSLSEARPISTLYSMGRAFAFLGDTYDEEEYFERSIALLTEALFQDEAFLPVLYQLASCYLHLGELSCDKNTFSMARLYYEELLTLDPEDELAWIDYALTLIHLGEASQEGNAIPQEWFQAEEALCTAQNLGQPFALYQKACLYSLMGNFPEAMEYLYEALREEELPDLTDLLEDEWLESLVNTEPFQKFMKEVEKTSFSDSN
jgi:tetratricopeptide (TPR) repeat protein